MTRNSSSSSKKQQPRPASKRKRKDSPMSSYDSALDSTSEFSPEPVDDDAHRDAASAPQVDDARDTNDADGADGADDADDEPPSYTIDEFAAHTGIPSRTIRFYQSSGALQKPVRKGRVAYYGPEHVERLALIGQLQDRGLRMRAIADLVERIDRGEVALDEWLGLAGELKSAWTDDKPQVLTRTELETKVGERRPGFLADLVRHDLAQSQPNGTFLVPSPRLLDLALEAEDAHVGLDVTAGATRVLQKHLERAASELSDHLVDELGGGDGPNATVSRMTEALRRLRPVTQEWVRIIFAREMERVLRERIESGDATPKAKRKRKRKH